MQYILIALVCAGILHAQPHPKFDAASLKPDARGVLVAPLVAMQGGPGTKDPRVFRISYGQRLKVLISKAWDVPVDQIFGPASLDDGLYIINATLPLDTTKENFQLMLQDLLTERFHLTLHRETKDFPGYTLVLASDKPDMKKLKEWKPDPNAVDPPPPRICNPMRRVSRYYAGIRRPGWACAVTKARP